MYTTLKAKGETWVLNQTTPFLDVGVGIITEIYDEKDKIGIEISLNSGGEIFVLRVPIVNKEKDDFETFPPQKDS